jgi:hypothetical protein
MFVVIDVLLHLLQWPRHAIADAGVPESSSPRAKQLMGYKEAECYLAREIGRRRRS